METLGKFRKKFPTFKEKFVEPTDKIWKNLFKKFKKFKENLGKFFWKFRICFVNIKTYFVIIRKNLKNFTEINKSF